MPLEFTTRIRDLVHGFVYITKCEEDLINHHLYQRLRFIAHNDISSYVYPSLNTTRFEHSIGTLHVANKMVESVLVSSDKDEFLEDCELGPKEFQQIIRLYALLHDVGHPPLSHLFEAAFTGCYVPRNSKKTRREAVKEWTGNGGYDELHESLSYNYAQKILSETKSVVDYKDQVLDLMKPNNRRKRSKDPYDPLLIGKKIIASDIDADRVDSIARDGLLAGGEYGNYDIERLTKSLRVIKANRRWALAFDHKAISALESLLFERFRTYTRIHFHHRAIAFKTAARIAITKLFLLGNLLTKECFSVDNPKLPFIDDVWLWSLIRETAFKDENPVFEISKDAVLTRNKKNMVLLWKHPWDYWESTEKFLDNIEEFLTDKEKKAWEEMGREFSMIWFGETDYRQNLSDHFVSECACQVKVHSISFKPVNEKNDIYLCRLSNEVDKKLKKSLSELSPIVKKLNDIWYLEPQFYVIAIGKKIPRRLTRLREVWADFTAKYFGRRLRTSINEYLTKKKE